MKPDYHVFLPNSDGYWMKLGAAWIKQTQDGSDYISVKVDALPLNFDGQMTLHPPREEGVRPLNPAEKLRASRTSKTKFRSRKRK